MSPDKILLTTGEPAGVGPDIALAAACRNWPAKLIVVGNRALLEERRQKLGLDVSLEDYTSTDEGGPHLAGSLSLIDLPLKRPVKPGVLDSQNASFVLAQLQLAVELCKAHEVSAMVTGPVHKGIINDAGIPFSGHTEFLAKLCNARDPLMLLVGDDLRVALATTHIPLRKVPAALTTEILSRRIQTLHYGLREQFGITAPKITVLGLNPHAGENGYLGDEEQEIIGPVCDSLRMQHITILGPIPADTAFTPPIREKTDAYLAMYHDQGLTVLKTASFQNSVNYTLGLPIIRASVDHGTALDLAGSGKANAGSLHAAISLALKVSELKFF